MAVEAQGWQSATLTARFPSPAAATSAALSWKRCLQGPGAASGTQRSGPRHVYVAGRTRGGAASPSRAHVASGSGFVSFSNHPDEGLFVLGWPDAVAIEAWSQVGALSPTDTAALARLLGGYRPGQRGGLAAGLLIPPLLLCQRADACHGGRAARCSRNSLMRMAAAQCTHLKQALCTPQRAPDAPARRLMLAQHRSSVLPVALLPALCGIAPLRRLELSLDAHWPPQVCSEAFGSQDICRSRRSGGLCELHSHSTLKGLILSCGPLLCRSWAGSVRWLHSRTWQHCVSTAAAQRMATQMQSSGTVGRSARPFLGERQPCVSFTFGKQ